MTECNQEAFQFAAHFSRRVEAGFTAGRVSSDGGALLVRQVDRKIALLDRLAVCFQDGRDPERIDHTVEEMLSQRIYGPALGYEDLNDHEQLRSDPLFGLLSHAQNPELTRNKVTPLALNSPSDFRSHSQSAAKRKTILPARLKSLLVRHAG